MALFSYKGRNAGGDLVEGTLESVDTGQAAALLFSGGVTPVSIDAAESASGAASTAKGFNPFREKVTDADLMLFCRQLYALLKSGVPIMQGLSGLQQSTGSKAFGAVLGNLRASLDSGRDLSAAMAREAPVFSEFFVNMVRVGETSGRLEEIFQAMYEHLEFGVFMRNQVKSALRYPSFVIAAMTAAIFVINLLVIPAFAKVFKGFQAQLPLMTRILIGFSDFMVAYWWLLAAAGIAAVFAARTWVARPDGRLAWDAIKLGLPIAGKIIKKATLARFARSFALASRSGVPIVQGLTLVGRTVDNAFIADKVEKMRTGVERGESLLRTAVASKIFTPVVLQMVQVGEDSGQLDNLMEDVAQIYQREVEYELKTLSSQIEPILIVALGVMVLMLALGIFLPMWDLGKVMMQK
jgi:MSHA biogenesis protein MshG